MTAYVSPRFSHLRPILYWKEVRDGSVIKDGPDPHDFTNVAVDQRRCERVVYVIASAPSVEAWRGWANCRICGAHLGSHDLAAFGFIFPEFSEHYLIKHGLWMPELDDLYEASMWPCPRVMKLGVRNAEPKVTFQACADDTPDAFEPMYSIVEVPCLLRGPHDRHEFNGPDGSVRYMKASP